MATKKDEIRGAYPLPVYNYRVTVNGEYYAFSEASGLTMEVEPVTYKHGLSFLEGARQAPGMRGEVRLTLKRGIIPRRSELLSWFRSTQRSKADPRDVIIDLCDERGVPVISWRAYDAFPVKLEGPSLTADANEIAIESMELLANFLDMVYHD